MHDAVGMRSISKLLGLLCLLLTVSSAIGLITHHHSSRAESSACQVCVAAHSTAPTSISPTPKPVFRTILTLQLRPAATTQRLIAFALYIRPPPSV